GTSTDIWWVMDLIGLPLVVRNQPPLLALNTPTNNQYFLGTADIPLQANASDSDGSVSKVDFFVDGSLAASVPFVPSGTYNGAWTNVTVGTHLVQATATDDQGGTSTASANI